jgi:type II secretory pathway pseudopilin PulG
MKNREQETGIREQPEARPDGEQGFMLLGLIVAIAVILLVLGMAATNIAFSIRREREVESARRANQYVLAIRRFYAKTGRYPGSIQQLLNTNNIRYLRKEYVDPLTGQADYRLIAVGQNKTTVTGFFGEPLAGIASAGLGSAAGMQSSGIGGALGANGTAGAGGAAGGFGASSGFGGAGGIGAGGVGGVGTSGVGAGGLGASGAGAPGSTDTSGTNGQTSGLGSAAGMASPFGGGSSGPIMGVGSSASGNSILELNEQTTYQTWEFLYDPRLEKLKQAAALNQGLGSVGAGSLGGQTPGGFGQQPGGFGQQPGGFGQSGGFGQQPGGFGSSGGTGGAGPTGATPQP